MAACPGQGPRLPAVASGRARSQGGGPVQPGQSHERPGTDPGVDGHRLGEVAERLVGLAEQRRQLAELAVQRAAHEHRSRPGGSGVGDLGAEQVIGGLCRLPVAEGIDQDDHRPERAERVEVGVPGGGQVAERLVHLACLLGPAGGEQCHGV